MTPKMLMLMGTVSLVYMQGTSWVTKSFIAWLGRRAFRFLENTPSNSLLLLMETTTSSVIVWKEMESGGESL